MTEIVFLLSGSVLFVVPMIFVRHRVYQDGVIGRGGLLSISFFAAVFLMKYFMSDYSYELQKETVGMMASFAVFIVWHLWRFHRRVLKGYGNETVRTGSR